MSPLVQPAEEEEEEEEDHSELECSDPEPEEPEDPVVDLAPEPIPVVTGRSVRTGLN